MSFTVSDFNDLKQLLVDNPEWRVELRHLLLTEDIEALPGLVRDLMESHRRAEERLTRLEEVVRGLAEDQRQMWQQLKALADEQQQMWKQLRALAEEQRKLAEEQRKLAEAQRETAEHVRRLTDQVARLTDKVGRLDGSMLEMDYTRKATSYFGRWLRRAKPVDPDELWEPLEAHLGRERTREALLADLVVRGRVEDLADRPEVYLAVEVSAVIDEHDVTRAAERAGLFRQAGFPAIPVVAGREATAEANALAESRGVAMLQDGRAWYWEEALANWPVT